VVRHYPMSRGGVSVVYSLSAFLMTKPGQRSGEDESHNGNRQTGFGSKHVGKTGTSFFS